MVWYMDCEEGETTVANSRGARRWKAWLRTVHIHLSLFGLILMLFFAATGFMMNHEHWFEMPPRTETILGDVPVTWLAEPDKLAIVELLRDQYGAVGRLSEFEVNESELNVSFRKPGRSTDAQIFRDDGYMTVELETEGVVAAMAQLHQGKRSGDVGGLMVDLVVIVLGLTAISGLVLWTTLPARRVAGIASVTVGVLLALVSWWYLVL